VTSAELASIGIRTVEEMRDLGWEEVCIRWVEAFPLRLNLNAFHGVQAAIEGIDWRRLDEESKRRARQLRDRLAREQGPPSRHQTRTRSPGGR
jgi:hypothetical protein